MDQLYVCIIGILAITGVQVEAQYTTASDAAENNTTNGTILNVRTVERRGVECFTSGEIDGYSGTQAVTVTGKQCQRWDSQQPHAHSRTDDDKFPDATVADAANYCRNPDGEPEPWCYTTDEDVRWEYCGIAKCAVDCFTNGEIDGYSGTQAVTVTGKQCQRWDSQQPHAHSRTDGDKFPDATVSDAANYCRNPDGEPEPWCYTTDEDVRWEYCGIAKCADCLYTSEGLDYVGTISVTVSGRTCQRWDSQSPHSHGYDDSDTFPDESVSAAENYCRNPSHNPERSPWCYTTDKNKRWELCDIQFEICRGECFTSKEIDGYTGTRGVTVTGKQCQRWDTQEPHSHSYTDADDFPDATVSDAANYCRNPGEEPGPWCFTANEHVRWEFCAIEKCGVTYEEVSVSPECISSEPKCYRNSFETNTKHWRDDILKGVTMVAEISWVGNLIVLGTNAEPILTGKNHRDVFMAVAQFGQGRIFAAGHREYANWFTYSVEWRAEHVPSFCDNVLKWVTDDAYDSSWTIQKISNVEDLVGIDRKTVLVWPVQDGYNPAIVVQLTEMVKSGFGLIVGVIPWRFSYYGIVLENELFYQFLAEAGIYCLKGGSFTYTSFDNSVGGATVADNKAVKAHTGHWLRSVIVDNTRHSYDNEMLTALDYIPGNAAIDCAVLTSLNLTDLLPRPPTNSELFFPTNHRFELEIIHFLVSKTQLIDKLAGLQNFPGDFDTAPSKGTIEVDIASAVYDVHATGAYAEAGCAFTIEILSGSSTTEGWSIQVGAHTDNLIGRSTLPRWPKVYIEQPITVGPPMEVKTPYGGLIYIVSPNQNANARFRLSNVVEAPLFQLSNPNYEKDWPEASQKPGLWADFVGRYIQFTLPSDSIRNIQDPAIAKEALDFWDNVVSILNDLRGVDLQTKRREWFVADIKPSAGYMHSGYPIVTHLDVADPASKGFFIRKPTNYSDSSHWGHFHELGHNLQDSRWTFDDFNEVTVNIFTLYAQLEIFGVQPWEHPWLEGQKSGMIDNLKKGAILSDQGVGVRLGIYAQLARDFGFDTYKKVFRYYETNPDMPTMNNEEEINKWVQVFSNAAEKNLSPLYKFWGYTLSKDTLTALANLDPYLPDDEVTNAVPERVQTIKNEFGMN